jgi:hypothetical protein
VAALPTRDPPGFTVTGGETFEDQGGVDRRNRSVHDAYPDVLG